MSSEGRREPIFENPVEMAGDTAPSINTGTTFTPRPIDPFVLEEEPDAGAAAMLLRSGIVLALVLGAFGGYKYHQGNFVDNQFADGTRTDWAGRPLATNEQGNLIWPDEEGSAPRNIDLTQTASINSKPEPKIIEAKPVPSNDKISANAQFHIVESGDTLSAIARTYKVSTADIMAINSIENPRKIKPGMKLFVTR